MSAKRGLGRGLDALLQGFGEGLGAPEIVQVPAGRIRPNPKQPRRDFDEAALAELAESIRTNGVLQPILVRPVDDPDHLYELVAGERRWRASQLANLAELPAIVRTMSDEESLAIALIENLQREDLNPIEEALGLQRLQEEFGLTQEQMAEKVGKSRPAIANMLRLTQLPEPIQRDIRTGVMTAGHGRALLVLTGSEDQEAMRQRIVERALSVREAEAMAAYWKRTGVLPGEEGAQRPAGHPPARVRKSPGQALPEALRETLEDIEAVMAVPVALRGGLDKGQLVLHYSSLDELNGILRTIGVPLVESATRRQDADE
jgi:ParB family chromosome partitioning protein